jgi:hypothetical protein
MPRPKKVIEKKSLDPVEAKIVNEKPEEGSEGKIAPRTYKGIEILRFIAEDTKSYHIQLANGTSTWVKKEEIDGNQD